MLDPHSADIAKLLRQHGYAVAHADDHTHGIDCCTREAIDAVIVDQCYFGEPDGWRVAPMLKRVRPQIAVLLLLHGPIPEQLQLPTAVDCMVSDRNVQRLLAAIREYAQHSLKH